MCAEFLGAIYSEHAEAWGFGNAKNVGSTRFQEILYDNVIHAQRFETIVFGTEDVCVLFNGR